jgi:hypothetical protein
MVYTNLKTALSSVNHQTAPPKALEELFIRINPLTLWADE